MPLATPRQAFEMSKLRTSSESPSFLTTAVDVAGSAQSRETPQKSTAWSSDASIPDFSSAAFAARTAASLGIVPGFQNRRSLMPVISSRRPTERRRRLYNGSRLSSSSWLVTMRPGRTRETHLRCTFENLMLGKSSNVIRFLGINGEWSLGFRRRPPCPSNRPTILGSRTRLPSLNAMLLVCVHFVHIARA